MEEQPKSSRASNLTLEVARSLIDEAVQRPWLAVLLLRRTAWLAALAQRLRNLSRHARRFLRRAIASGLAIGILFLTLVNAPPGYANAISVNGDGSLGTCSLSDAITAANTDAISGNCPAGSSGLDLITLAVDVNLSATLPDIESEVTIEGANHTIQRTGGPNFSVLRIASGATVTLNQATISGGNYGYGGGIFNAGDLTVQNSNITGNTGYYNGGGIYNAYNLTVQNSTISNNNVVVNAGGGIANGYVLNLQDSTISGNSAPNGAGVSNLYSLTVTGSTISGNNASFYGGGIYNNYKTSLQTTIIDNNSAPNGGGIFSLYKLDIQDSTISANTATDRGGGIDMYYSAYLKNSTISGNDAAYGAGIFNYFGNLTLQTCTVAQNSATTNGGGIENYYSLSLLNSTISGNSATGSGGGVFNYGAFYAQNSILAQQTLGDDCYNAYGTPISGGYNIESNATCGFDPTIVASDRWNVSAADLALATDLADNGGPTKTLALLSSSSVAVDRIPDGVNGCAAGVGADQRGFSRPADADQNGVAACDIGAFERLLQLFLPSVIK